MRIDDTINIRYMVDDVDEAVAFYTKFLDFELLTGAAPAFPCLAANSNKCSTPTGSTCACASASGADLTATDFSNAAIARPSSSRTVGGSASATNSRAMSPPASTSAPG